MSTSTSTSTPKLNKSTVTKKSTTPVVSSSTTISDTTTPVVKKKVVKAAPVVAAAIVVEPQQTQTQVESKPEVEIFVTPVVNELVEEKQGETDEQELVRRNRELSAKLLFVSQLLAEIRGDQKYIDKLSLKVEKNCKKKSKKSTKVKSTTRAPSGFIKPTLISDELATFLNKPFGSEMARTDVTKEINVYVRANDLKDKTNGRIINADSKLATLLKVGENDVLTYFNLQKYMSPHFAKSKPTVLATTA